MHLSKEKLQHFVTQMPEKIDVVELFDKILLMAKIEQANEDDSEHYRSHEQLEKEMDLWA